MKLRGILPKFIMVHFAVHKRYNRIFEACHVAIELGRKRALEAWIKHNGDCCSKIT